MPSCTSTRQLPAISAATSAAPGELEDAEAAEVSTVAGWLGEDWIFGCKGDQETADFGESVVHVFLSASCNDSKELDDIDDSDETEVGVDAAMTVGGGDAGDSGSVLKSRRNADEVEVVDISS